MTYPVRIERPKDLAAASKRLAALNEKGAALGGGLDLLELTREYPAKAPEILIPVRDVASTSYIEIRGTELRLGGSTTVAEIAESMGVKKTAWPLTEAAESVGSPQIRAQATLAGNLLQRPRCWYLRNGIPCLKNGGEGCPAVAGDNRYHAIFGGGPCYTVFHSDIGLALMALGAMLVIVSPEGERIMHIGDLYNVPAGDVTRHHTLKAGDIIREVRMKVMDDRHVGTFIKVRERGSFDFSLASIAIVYNNFHGRFKHMRMYLGGVAPAPYTPQKAMDFINFKKLSRKLIPQAADLAGDSAAPLVHNAYKIPIIKYLVRRAFETTYDKLSWRPD